MVEVVKINRFKKGCYLVTYKRYSPCLCTHTRHTEVMYAKRKPTLAQVEKFIFKR